MRIHSLFASCVLLAVGTLPLAAGSITTTFGEDDGASSAMFNLTVGGDHSVIVDGLSLLDNSKSDLTLDVYIKTGTYSGFETNPNAWTLVSATDVPKGNGSATATDVNVTPFFLKAGQNYGIYVTFNVTKNPPDLLYTRGSNTYSNSDLSLSLGEGLQGLFGTGGLFTGRTWDGTIDYTLASPTPEPGSLVLLGLSALPAVLFVRRRYLRKY